MWTVPKDHAGIGEEEQWGVVCEDEVLQGWGRSNGHRQCLDGRSSQMSITTTQRKQNEMLLLTAD
jgi:hypothetical protein